jgi:hypothetical protein
MSDETPKPSWEYIYSLERKAARLATAEGLVRELATTCWRGPFAACGSCAPCRARAFLAPAPPSPVGTGPTPPPPAPTLGFPDEFARTVSAIKEAGKCRPGCGTRHGPCDTCWGMHDWKGHCYCTIACRDVGRALNPGPR